MPGIYIHIPFCRSKCAYCDFVSFSGCECRFREYVEALKQEMRALAPKFSDKIFSSVYIGGGTPSILPAQMIAEILEGVTENFRLEREVSITVEANPNSLDLSKAQVYACCGVNRISIGLQTHHPELLKILNRPHNLEHFQNAVTAALAAGINDINADVLIGIPGQTAEILEQTLEHVTRLPVTHVSAYGLILEDGTPLKARVDKGELLLPLEDAAVKMYEQTVDFLREHGLERYEVSNFARPGFESRHNLNYWHRGEYLGLGLGAYSFMNGAHWENDTDLQKYIASPCACAKNFERETPVSAKNETIMLALRTAAGMDIHGFNTKFNCNFESDKASELEILCTQNLVKINDGFLQVRDFNLLNLITERLLYE